MGRVLTPPGVARADQFIDRILARLSALERRAGANLAPLVTALPASPYDGQVVRLLASASAGIIWTLRYRADSPNADKWELAGGLPLRALVATLEDTTSTSYAALATAHSLTVPLPGVYRIGLSCQVFATAAGATAFMAARVGANAATDSQGVRHTSASANAQGTPARSALEFTVGAAPQTISAHHKVTSGTGWFLQRELTAIPVRVSPA